MFWSKHSEESTIRILRILLVLGISLSLYQYAPPPSFHKQVAEAKTTGEVVEQPQPPKSTEASKKKLKVRVNKKKVTKPLTNRQIGQQMAAKKGWTGDQWRCLEQLWTGESNWNHAAHNSSSGAHGIPQSLPASKMASHGKDYLSNPRVQIAWGMDYIKNRYGSPCAALAFWNSQGPHWY